MQTKLTLRLDDALIDRAKRYARRHDQSVSQLVANFFSALPQTPDVPPECGGETGVGYPHFSLLKPVFLTT
jgi:hypothetical protein